MSPAPHHQTTTNNGSRNLLFFLVLYILGGPFIRPFTSLAIFAQIFLSVALLSAIYTVDKQQHKRSIAIGLLLPLLILHWLSLYNIIELSLLGASILFTIYYGLLTYSFILQIKNAHKVSSDVLYTTFCLYLIIGLLWGSLYSLLDLLSPGAYSGVLLNNAQDRFHDFNYFSFVTLTTLGYGDITPQTAGAAALCQMEAIVGQFYTAVVVAWFVGMSVSAKFEKAQKEK